MKKSISRLSILALFATLIMTTACKKEDTEVFIRVKNASSYEYERVMVNTSGGTFGYGTIKSEEVSSYQPFVFAYSYAMIRLEINTKEFTLIPTDYVGEETLEKGFYTYVVNVDNYADGTLLLEVIKD
jgi:hypothetical protein